METRPVKHRTWDQPVPVRGPHGIETHYQARCECGWMQAKATPKPSHAHRAGKRHKQQAATAA